jgi:transcriptional regulator with GAF, ATPase, and Fis domain
MKESPGKPTEESAINTSRVLSIIAELNEALSLTNEPGLLANAALDALTSLLGVECAWLQTADGGALRLAAGRGLTPAMEAQLTALGQRHPLRQAVLGRGETACFPDLTARAAAVPAAFRQAGLRWLVAAPLMTHRAGGILGVASAHRKTYDRDLPSLVRVMGGMVGGALQKVRLGAPAAGGGETAERSEPATPTASRTPREDSFFQRHKHRMALFRHEHGEPQF